MGSRSPCAGTILRGGEVASSGHARHVRRSIYSKRLTVAGGAVVRCRYQFGWTRWGAYWPIQLRRPCAAAMRPYVILLWPFVSVWCAYHVTSHQSSFLFCSVKYVYRLNNVSLMKVNTNTAIIRMCMLGHILHASFHNWLCKRLFINSAVKWLIF